jgi:heptaprenyl diphosphate synthase
VTTKKMVLLSGLTAISIVLNWMENVFLPWTILPVPGVRIGLANVVFLTVLLIAGFKIALTLSILRVIILALLTGTFATVVFPISLGGAISSILVMKLVCFLFQQRISVIGISITGAVGHNLGQLAVLSMFPQLFPGLSVIYVFLPFLLLLSIPTGIITGWITKQILSTVQQEWNY